MTMKKRYIKVLGILILCIILGLCTYHTIQLRPWSYWMANDISFTTTDLAKVQWIGEGKIDNLMGKRVIAIVFVAYDFDLGKGVPPRFTTTSPYRAKEIITNPRKIFNYVRAIQNASLWKPGPNDDRYLSNAIQFVFEDMTGISILYDMEHIEERIFFGVGWKSKPLFELFEKDYGPFK
jgi:hypothetical protein